MMKDRRRLTVDVRVEWYAGHRAEEIPRRLLLGDRRVEVREVSKRWRTPAGCGFQVRGDDGADYVIVQDEASGRWALADR
jgi:hypothetical protein